MLGRPNSQWDEPFSSEKKLSATASRGLEGLDGVVWRQARMRVCTSLSLSGTLPIPRLGSDLLLQARARIQCRR